jgi:hypothetical protein
MPTVELVPCLRTLWNEFDRIAPNRDDESDGWIGDAAHQDSVSDHNNDETGNVPIRDADDDPEVHALDVDVNLRESDLTMEKVVQHILKRCRSGVEKRLRYIIYNKRIWRASNGWEQETYTGSNDHSHHAHFSASYVSSLEANTSSWRLEDIPVALTNADKAWIVETIGEALRTEINQVAGEVLAAKTNDPSNTARTVRNHLVDLSQVRDYVLDASNALPGVVRDDSPLGRMVAAADRILAAPASGE